MAYTRIKIEDAARQLGMSQQAVRIQMQKKILPIGMVFCGSNKPQRQTYVCYQELIDEFMKGGKNE